MKTEKLIYWDTQDPRNTGAAFRTPNDSGPLEFVRWAHVSGRTVSSAETEGYHLRDFFRGPDGAYAGPDQDGIFPVLE